MNEGPLKKLPSIKYCSANNTQQADLHDFQKNPRGKVIKRDIPLFTCHFITPITLVRLVALYCICPHYKRCTKTNQQYFTLSFTLTLSLIITHYINTTSCNVGWTIKRFEISSFLFQFFVNLCWNWMTNNVMHSLLLFLHQKVVA